MAKSGQILDSFDVFSASSVGDYGMVEHIVKNERENVNKVNSSGWTPLMYAANYGHFNIIRLLLRYDCNVDQKDWQGRTALMLAAANGHTRSIDALINHGKADKAVKDLSGANAYQYAKRCGHGNNKLIRALLLNSDGYELKGRSASYSRPEPTAKVMPSNLNSSNGASNQTPNKEMYNPYKKTAFSNFSLKSLSNGDHKYSNCPLPYITSDPPNPSQGLHESGFSNHYSSSPPDSANTSEASALSSSQSSNSSAISLPPNYKPKAITSRKTTPLVQISSPMEKTLFHLLTRIDLIQYLDLLENNGIDFYQFLTLTDDDFQKLGITSFGHRKKLSISQLRYHESLDINCTHESFLVDYLLNERDSLNQKIQGLEKNLMKLSGNEDK